MPSKMPMFTVIMPDELYDRIEDFRFNNRFSSRNQALIHIIKAGMNALKHKHPELDFSKTLERLEDEIEELAVHNELQTDED